jgi:hypothetical protein
MRVIPVLRAGNVQCGYEWGVTGPDVAANINFYPLSWANPGICETGICETVGPKACATNFWSL